MKAKPIYYKALGSTGEAIFGGTYRWPLPEKVEGEWRPGDWTVPVVGKLAVCRRGYHLCVQKGLIYWLAPRLFVAQAKRRPSKFPSDPKGKFATRQARLLRELTGWNEDAYFHWVMWGAAEVLRLHNTRENFENYAASLAFFERMMTENNLDKFSLRDQILLLNLPTRIAPDSFASSLLHGREYGWHVAKQLVMASASQYDTFHESFQIRHSFEQALTRKLFELIGEEYVED